MAAPTEAGQQVDRVQGHLGQDRTPASSTMNHFHDVLRGSVTGGNRRGGQFCTSFP